MFGMDFQSSADQMRPFFHAEESQSNSTVVTLGGRREIETSSVVADHQGYFVLGSFQIEPCMGSMRVLGNIHQCFLGDPIKHEFHFSRHPAFQTSCLVVDRNAGLIANSWG